MNRVDPHRQPAGVDKRACQIAAAAVGDSAIGQEHRAKGPERHRDSAVLLGVQVAGEADERVGKQKHAADTGTVIGRSFGLDSDARKRFR
jgi:hypothetical protein